MTAVKASRTSLRAVSQWQDPERVEKLVSLAKDGMAYKDIAAQLNTTATCVKGKLEQMGIKKAQWFKPTPKPAFKKVKAASDAGNIAQARIRDLQVETGNVSAPRRFSWEDGA